MGTNELTSVLALARRLGVTEGAIRKGFKGGRFPTGLARQAGKLVVLDAQTAMLEWVRTRDPGKATGADSTIEEARKRKLEADAIKVETENRRRAGQLVDARQVEREQFAIARTVRDSLFNLVPRLTPILMAITDRSEFERAFEDGIRDGLSALAEIFDRAAAAES